MEERNIRLFVHFKGICFFTLSHAAALTFFLFFYLAAPAQTNRKTEKRPNILLIVSDDHAYQAISAYGSKLMQTPAIDRIAREGMRFDRAYVTNSICGPSRAVILTGKYSHQNGFRDNVNNRFDSTQNTFIKELSAAGYQTAWIGKWHLGSQPQGFHYWKILPGQGSYYNPDFLTMNGGRERQEGYVTNLVQDEAEQWLNRRDTSQPFCLVIGHKNTHRTWMPDIPDLRRFDSVSFPLPDNFYDNYSGRPAALVQDMTIDKTLRMDYDLKMYETGEKMLEFGFFKRMNPAQQQAMLDYYRPIYADLQQQNPQGRALIEWKYQRYMRDYLATAASLDRNIGRALDYLDRHGLAQNTIVIYISDQGFYLGEHGWFDKRFMYEESFRTPLVLRYPTRVKPGTVNEQLVMNLDIGPTLLDIAGIRPPADMQGRSMLPQLTNPRKKGRKAMYYHYYENGEHAVSPHFGISTRRYKLIRFYEKVEGWELYDLERDPAENNNVVNDKRYQKTRRRLEKQLTRLVSQYEDAEAATILARPVDRRAF